MMEFILTGQEELAFLEGKGTLGRLMRLSCSLAGQTESALRKLTIAQWESHLLELRKNIVGRKVEGEFNCPNCDQKIEIDFDITELVENLQNEAENSSFSEPELLLETLIQIENENLTSQESVQLLLSKLLGISKSKSAKMLKSGLSTEIIERLETLISGHNMELLAECFECENEVKVLFDVTDFVEDELDQSARNILDQFHQIASQYNWSETAIMALPRKRRLAYLTRIEARTLQASHQA